MAALPPDHPTFVLGVGAQKSGTTWLFEYLNHFEEADFGNLKEYHIWDGLYVEAFNEFDMRQHTLTPRKYARMVKRTLLGRTQDGIVIRRSMQRDPERYFDYFAAILSKPGIELTGDITPSYSGLPQEALNRIKDGFEARGIGVKVVFLMRDPIERSLSAIRMYRRMKRTKQGVNIELADDEALLDYLRSAQSHLRSDYPKTLQTVASVFAPERVYTGFYENMFEISQVKRLSAFFELPENTKFLERKFNVTVRNSQVRAETRRQAMAHFADIYDYCFTHFPETRQLWSTDDAPLPH